MNLKQVKNKEMKKSSCKRKINKWVTGWMFSQEYAISGMDVEEYKRKKEDGTWWYRNRIKE